ncbi:Bacterial phosphonate metabolism protein (PhnI) [uncultured Roseburia sp.]|uniref:Carbon-phosphorus lyase complex subunit PhnI n=1 Tax=Brotonthovivens ammoniilytica TaxID=2981725 RepID=A0ABT2TGV4_9FIRM|nr:carbon-phosphorus lyase complex subunit PhnI [Brotonthovivens ammoniilytica]MCU6761423.1 carbon-phosphorus lyase complex subunit PhnI [Brotonthovivens ammoniilytica]SCI28010.1 Bacterial phosphonate metabolism protein (PhnI) [uncultured Roseburia sp.]
MAYVAVKGGEAAIEQSLKLLKHCHAAKRPILVEDILENMPYLIDQIMSEAGLYAPEYAALALKQSSGSTEEAVFLLRAYRSTLKRDYYSLPEDCKDMRICRRISASFKDIPGGQILGPTFDYSHRMLDFSLMDDKENFEAEGKEDNIKGYEGEACGQEEVRNAEDIYCTRVDDILRKDGVLEEVSEDDSEPFDVTTHVLTFPAPRSARLQTLTRSETGFLEGVAYSAMRGYGAVHPTVSELRSGWLSIEIMDPLEEGETIVIGELYLTEVEALWPSHTETDEEFDQLTLSGGYGCVIGRNETKAIAMSIADASLNTVGGAPSQDEEFVLTHGDCLEMQGFISHLKLPHYVTFQSKLDRVRKKENKHD